MTSSSTCTELQNDLGHTDTPLDKMNEANLQHKGTNAIGEQRLDINTKYGGSESESRSCPDPPDSGSPIQTESLTQADFSLEVSEQENSGPEVCTQSDSCSEEKEKLKENVQAESGSEVANQTESCNAQAVPVLEMDSQNDSEKPSLSVGDKRKERLRRIYDLRLRKNEARKLNHVEVVEEDKRNKRPTNWEARKRKVEWEVAEEEARKQAEQDGEDYDRIKMLETSASELERKERKILKKKNPDKGFSDFAQAQHRQYERLTKQMEPDMTTYKKMKQEMGESFYPGVNTLIHGSKPSEHAVNRMVDDLEKQIEKRSKFSRRRALNEEADVDYINDRNMRFNKKAARFYDQYTTEIKQNLERGTAV